MSDAPAPYLGQDCVTPNPRGEVLRRWLWLAVQSTFFRWSPRPFHGFRAALLRLFGAQIAGPVVIFPTVKVIYPWKLALESRSMVGPHVNLYNLAPVRLIPFAHPVRIAEQTAGAHRDCRNAQADRDVSIGRSSIKDRLDAEGS